MIHIFIWHKWNKIICFETIEKRETFLKIILLNFIDFDESICIIFVNLLDFDNDFDDLNLNIFLSKSQSWSLEIYNMKSFINQDFLLFILLHFEKIFNMNHKCSYTWIEIFFSYVSFCDLLKRIFFSKILDLKFYLKISYYLIS